jgi:ribonuclease D
METLILRERGDFEAAFERLSLAEMLGCDTETSGLDASNGRLFSIQFSDGDFSVLIPVSEGIEPGPFTEILRNDSIVKIFHNARFDLAFLTANGIEVRNVFDTMIAEKFITRGARQGVGLSETLYRYFAVDLDKSPRKKFNRKWDGIWTEELVNYALSDVVYLPRLCNEQSAWLERLGLAEQCAAEMRRLFAMIDSKQNDGSG